ncbi:MULTISPECIES: helix-turn-helix transcriptional regulator [unclassified Streptomyces]|uniref:helix-turn-helix domain-containing protein n=1 Tax=unclassified Streptomyces TaxID=2593676 RepID=UPI000DC33CD0|nr:MULTISPECIES: helix-turn-helix transcriptional regulator [unclassified Streptomyces]MYT71539.1 hypothetical protein [Streptomyces sp. SID8367]RAJ83002.1 hypothetical protein K377_04057 [Streptomyces sp. PsTaAH-137]
MPPRGETKDESLPGCSAEETALARALQEACRRARHDLGSQRELAKRISCAESTLSSWIRGRKIPHLNAAHALLGLAAPIDGKGPAPDDKELVALSRLWVRAKAARAYRHAAGEAEKLLRTDAGSKSWDSGTGTAFTARLAFYDDPKPADPGVGDGHGDEASGTEASPSEEKMLPVPPPPGDRQRFAQQPDTNTRLEEQLVMLLGSKPGPDSLPVLNHIAARYPVDDIVRVVRICRERNTLSPAADVVLRNAGHYRSVAEIFALADALHHAGRSSDAGLLINVAATQHPVS